MRDKSFGPRAGVLLAAIAVVAGISGVLDLRLSRAGDDSRVRLLVKCERKALPSVLRGLAAQGAEAWDLDTMQRLSPPTPAPRSPPTRVSLALPDATRVMQEILIDLQGLRDEAGGALVEADELAVQQRRAVVRCIVSDPAVFDAVRRTLSKNAHLQSRAHDPRRAVEAGAQKKLPDGRWRQSFSLKFREDVEGEPRLAPSPATIPVPTVRGPALATRMQVIYAGPVQDDPNRGRGYHTISREFTFAPTRLVQLTKLLGRLATDPAGFTVIEVRWQRDRGKSGEERAEDVLHKPVVKVGIRLSLER